MALEIFAYAAINKVRFQTSRGPLSVEQLAELPATSRTSLNLTDIIEELDKEEAAITGSKRRSTAKPSTLLLNKIAIVEYLLDYKAELAEAAKTSKTNADKRAVIAEKIAAMETDALTDGKSLKELKKAFAKLV